MITQDVRRSNRYGRARVVAAAGAALLLVVAAAGCSSSGGSNATASASASADVVWAGDVCSGVTGVQDAVKNLGDGVKLDPQDAAASLDAAKTQITAQLTAVQDAADQLVTTVTTLPPGTSSELQAKEASLKSQATALKSALEDVKTAAADVPDATSPQGFVSAVGDMVVPLTTAALDAKLLVTSLTGYASSTKENLKTAFTTAPSCAALQSK